MSSCRRQCDWDEHMVCRSCGIDYSPPKKLRPFHLAFPVDDMEKAVAFYTENFGCTTGRRKEESCVLNFFGHQVVAHKVDKMPVVSSNDVDGKPVPAMHFGLVLEWNEWHQLKAKLTKNKVNFYIRPYTRYQGKPGEQATMFLVDPCGNHLEFKSFKDDIAIFDAGW